MASKTGSKTDGGVKPDKQNRVQQLRGFCCTAQCGSISKAAERMQLSQPSVSLQIQALEREFKVKLFERRGPKISLTSEGKALYQLASPLVEQIDRLPESFAAMRGEVESGRIDIAAGESTILYLLPQFVQQYMDGYPKVEVKLHNVTGRKGLELIRAGEVDFAVGSMIDQPEDIEYRPKFTYPPVLITPIDHPLCKLKRLTMRDISRYPLILPPKHLTTRGIIEQGFQQHNCSYQVKLEAGGWEVIKKYVELGLGVSIVTGICLTGDERVAAIPVNRYFPMRTYGIVYRKGKHFSPQAKRLIEIMGDDRHRQPGSGRRRSQAK